jgi:hypothetical protein
VASSRRAVSRAAIQSFMVVVVSDGVFLVGRRMKAGDI